MTDSVSFPIECPQCHAISGMPYRAATTAGVGVIVVSLRCMGCGQQWVYDMPIASDPFSILTSTGVAIDRR